MIATEHLLINYNFNPIYLYIFGFDGQSILKIR